VNLLLPFDFFRSYGVVQQIAYLHFHINPNHDNAKYSNSKYFLTSTYLFCGLGLFIYLFFCISPQVLRGGEIVQAGNYDELLQTGTDFSTLVHAHHEAISGMGGITSSSSRNNLHWNTAESVSSHVLNGNAKAVDQDEVDEISSQVIESGQQQQLQQFEVELTDPEAPKPQQLVTEEERERGTVNLGVYWSYLTAVYQGALIVIIVIMQVCFQVC